MGLLQGLVANGGYLYAAWKSAPNDDRIFYSRWNGKDSWAAASPMASSTVNGNTSAGPSLGVGGGKLYAAWKGEWSDPRLFFARFSSSTWEAQVQIPNAYSDVGPAICGLGTSELVAAWKGIDQNLWYSVLTGSIWTAPKQILGVASSVGPSLASHGGLLYAAWKGGGGDQRLWWATYDGTGWSAQSQIPGAASSVGPALAFIGSTLYAVWKGEETDQRLWWADYDPATTKWSTQAAIPNTGSSVGAAIADFNGLYAFWKGEGSDVRLYNASLNKSTWSVQATDIPGTTGPDPTSLMPPPPGGGNNYVLSDSKGAALTGLTVTIIITEDLVSLQRTDGSYRYAFEINCHSKKDAAHPDKFDWQQFMFDVDTERLSWWVNCFLPHDGGGSPSLGSPRTRLAGLASNRLLQGSQLTMTLTTDHSNNVTGVTFSFTPPNGPAVSSGLLNLTSLSTNVTSANLAPVIDVQVILSGEFNKQQTVFSSGQGIFLFYETNSLVAGAGQGESAEGSNVRYSALPASYPNGEFFQFFGFPDA